VTRAIKVANWSGDLRGHEVRLCVKKHKNKEKFKN
jgi:hypothetical protein